MSQTTYLIKNAGCSKNDDPSKNQQKRIYFFNIEMDCHFWNTLYFRLNRQLATPCAVIIYFLFDAYCHLSKFVSRIRKYSVYIYLLNLSGYFIFNKWYALTILNVDFQIFSFLLTEIIKILFSLLIYIIAFLTSYFDNYNGMHCVCNSVTK